MDLSRHHHRDRSRGRTFWLPDGRPPRNRKPATRNNADPTRR
jgi:hypothetical protein